jgi:hypothetical protein
VTDLERAILVSYLQDCSGSEFVLSRIQRSRSGELVPDHWSGNCVFVDFYPDRAVISHQWLGAAEGRDAAVAISLDDAEALLRAEPAAQASVLSKVVPLLPRPEPAEPGTAPNGTS